ncbi:RpsE, Ribosomal protein S5 [Pyrenophora tritici-repentis]|uniref:Small ribosomal subunit protein uS5 n=1 Tax=Pyrenophora tritici-repentis TaxID=45151 RepID=A0A2W1DQJ2_9PLEO|nr:RpsE, Ribosomal protein S5 [Pyrenophora tritici-repentis]KAI1548976.1 RpsE Ribosomal protein S5 [Pyrenophora tritici-repentis]KAI1578981.1 RpsE Ribosomal protein S5 [Pyrenophora tritici-repentis]KAI1587981.1 RpsE Ribosomal protein S5 [Pyrenophora tritici-repentis]KAI1598760.1 RpsE Ribosomal protein S5 [Pyrenophora tritici-repentis]
MNDILALILQQSVLEYTHISNCITRTRIRTRRGKSGLYAGLKMPTDWKRRSNSNIEFRDCLRDNSTNSQEHQIFSSRIPHQNTTWLTLLPPLVAVSEKEWQPVTKLGRLVKAGKIKSMEEIYLHSLPIKEYQVVDFFLPKLKDEVMKIKPVQKQTRAGQRTRFKAIVVIGDSEGHIGLGIKTSKEVATAIRAAIIIAKLSVVPIRRGYWGTNLGEPHSLPTKESGKCGSVTVRLIPAPRGTGLVASPAVKRLLQLAGVSDIYTASSGSTKTLENTLKATFVAVAHTYGFLTPNLWKDNKLTPSPLEEYSDILREGKRY